MSFKNDGCGGGGRGELSLITVKSCFFHRLKNKTNCQGKLLFCQGNVREFLMDSNVANPVNESETEKSLV